MPEANQHYEHGAAGPSYEEPQRRTESDKCFEAERLEEARKRFGTYSLWMGLLSLLLLLIPNPFAPYAGVAAVLLGAHALVRAFLQPTRYGGALRAVIGIVAGLVATLVSLRW
jgi:hypothetical protein